MSTATQFREGRLTVSEVMTEKPAIIPLGTSLVRVADILSKSHFRHGLVSNAEQQIIGVVSSDDVLRHMADWTPEDSEHWESKTVESVMTTKFIAAAPSADAEDVAPLVTSSSIQCVPVLEGGHLVGLLTSHDLLLSWNRLTPVLREASTDCVTDLSNRSTFNRRLAEEWERSSRVGAALGLILIDVDHFKTINDSCGYATGDAVLQMVGACLRRHLRSYDVVARFGGDEFAAICCGCELEDIDVPI